MVPSKCPSLLLPDPPFLSPSILSTHLLPLEWTSWEASRAAAQSPTLGSWAWFNTLLLPKFLLISKLGALPFHFGLGPEHGAAGPACLQLKAHPFLLTPPGLAALSTDTSEGSQSSWGGKVARWKVGIAGQK